MKAVASSRKCVYCDRLQLEEKYSKTQWRKGIGGRCRDCVQGGSLGTARVERSNDHSNNASSGEQRRNPNTEPKPTICFNQRPQMPVPGFEDSLTVCTDWPQTKRGEPPAAQSAIFMPLLACAIGPIEGHCTSDQLAAAMEWWSLALPAWPRWVSTLRAAGVGPEQKAKLVAQAKGRPCLLIHKAKGVGTVPHFKGKIQVALLESDPGIATEVYACVATMYSQAAFGSQATREQSSGQKEAEVGAREGESK